MMRLLQILVYFTALTCFIPQAAMGAKSKGYNSQPPEVFKKEMVEIGNVNSKIKLTCPIREGGDENYITWYKDNEKIDNIYWERHEINGISLKIHNIDNEDSGDYVCKVTNGFGSDEAKIKLIVVDDPRSTERFEPVFLDNNTEDDKTFKRNEGESISFKCDAFGRPQAQIHWYFNDKIIQPNDFDNIRIKKNNQIKHKSTLFIENLSDSNSGSYRCEASNDFGTVSRKFQLSVSNFNNKLFIRESESLVEAQEGQSTFLECIIRSSTKPSVVTWLKNLDKNTDTNIDKSFVLDFQDKKLLVIKNDTSFEKSGDNLYSAKLNFRSAKLKDSGEFMCFVQSTKGYDYKNLNLRVHKVTREYLIIFVVIIGVVALILFAVLIYCLVKRKTNLPNVESPDVQENLVKPQRIGATTNQSSHPSNQQLSQQPPQTPNHQHHHPSRHTQHYVQQQMQMPQMQHPHQYMYQQQQYMANMNNNRNHGQTSKSVDQPTVGLPPPPPPPSLLNEMCSNAPSTSSDWGPLYPAIEPIESSGISSLYSQNQYEVPHLANANRTNVSEADGSSGSGRFSNPSGYGGSQPSNANPYLAAKLYSY